MAANKDVNIKLSIDNAKFTAGMNRAKQSLNGLSNTAGNLKNNLSLNTRAIQETSVSAETLARHCTVAGVALGAMAGYALKAAADIEQLQVSFGVLTGSTAVGDELLNSIKQFSAVTPFVTSDLAKASQTMLAFGIATEDIMPTIDMLGNVAMGNSEKLKMVSLAYSQIQAAGRLMGQDLLQLINAGFNPLKEISQATGKSMGELKDMMSKGAISSELVTMAFKRATSEGGLFYGMMEKQSQTLAGRFSTLQENIEQTAQSFGAALAPAAKAIINVFISLTSFLMKIPQPIQAVLAGIVTLGSGLLLIAGITPTLVSGFKSVVLGLNLLKGGFINATRAVVANTAALLTNPFGQIALAITALIAAIVVLIANWDKITEAFNRMKAVFTSEVLPAWNAVVDSFKNGVKNILDKVTGVLSPILDAGKKLVTNILDGAKSVWNNVTNWFKSVFDALLDLIDDIIGPAVELGKTIITNIYDGAKSVWNTVIDWFKSAFGGLFDILKNIAKTFINIGKAIIQYIWNGFKSAFPGLATNVKKLGASLGNMFKAAFKKNAETEATAKAKVDTSDAKMSLADLDKQIQETLSKATGTGGKSKKGKKGKTQAQLNKEELTAYQKLIDEKIAKDEKYEALKLSLAKTTATQKLNIEKQTEEQKIAYLTQQLEQLGITKQEIENVQADQLYEFDLSRFNKKEQDKIRLLQGYLNDAKIAHNENNLAIAEEELNLYKTNLTKMNEQDEIRNTLKRQQMQLNNTHQQNLDLLLLQQQKLQEDEKIAYIKQKLIELGIQRTELEHSTSTEIYNFDLSKFDETQKQKILLYQQALNEMQIKSNDTSINMSNKMQNDMSNSFQGILSAGEGLFNNLSNFGDNWGQNMFSICQNIISMLTNALNLMNSFQGFSGGGGGLGGLFGGLISGFFADGGIVPGSYSNAKLVQAHGSEMILNPSQQSQLFALANGKGSLALGTGGTPGSSTGMQTPMINVINNIQSLEPQTAAKLVKDQMPYVKSQILEAINTSTTWRGTIKRAVQ